jgi:xylono-1,5-lactonase
MIVKPDWKILSSLRAEHGEGPVWDNQTQTFYWVDLLKGKLLSLKNGLTRQYLVSKPIGCIGICTDNKLILGLSEGFAILDQASMKLQWIFKLQQGDIKVRFNDGKVDPCGRFLAGTMTYDGKEPIGCLYSVYQQRVTCLEENVYISNGLDWSSDGKVFYFTDTNRHAIYKYNYDLDTGKIRDKKIFIQFDKNEFPDGLCVDSQGDVWVAMWGVGKLLRFDKAGIKKSELITPVQYPTSCCFGGPRLSTLYVTTSCLLLTEEQRHKETSAGCILTLETDTTGKAVNYYQE